MCGNLMVILYVNQSFDQYRLDLKIDIEWNVYRGVLCRSFSLKDFFSKCDQDLQTKSLMESFIFCAVLFRTLSNICDEVFFAKIVNN